MLEQNDKEVLQDAPVCGCGTSTSCCNDANSNSNTNVNENILQVTPKVSTHLNKKDILGTIMVRLGIARMSYTINPWLYEIGNPTPDSPVLVSANYKLSFDALRSSLTGMDVWILVIDTKGINVWCAAGKSTFCSKEVARMVELTGLSQRVSHNKLILPQLSAPGVSAHEITSLCGFKVIYGPVTAKDIPEFIDAGFKATPKMRHVEFGLKDRIILSPVEIVMGLKYAIIISAGLILLSGLGVSGYSIDKIKSVGVISAIIFMGSFIGSAIIGSALLPWIPGRAFAVKGLIIGLFMVILLVGFNSMIYGIINSGLTLVSWVFIIPSLSSFVVMNFTGATTFTSLSGVMLEMRYAIPAQIIAGLIGLGLWIGGLFI